VLQGPHFRIDVHSEALDGVATAMALIRVAMLGTRGVPASYSGFEGCAEEFGDWARRFPHRVVTDSQRVQKYYLARHGAPSPTYIACGAEPMTMSPGRYLGRYGLVPARYVLFVGRLVPENCAHHPVESFRRPATDFRCVIVGDAPYSAAYINQSVDGINGLVDGRPVSADGAPPRRSPPPLLPPRQRVI
jgi:glycosyltransferase involved in cell wall biosynthesis